MARRQAFLYTLLLLSGGELDLSSGTPTAWIASIGKFILFWELSRSSESFEAGLAVLAEADLEIESGTMLGSLTDMIIVPSGTPVISSSRPCHGRHH